MWHKMTGTLLATVALIVITLPAEAQDNSRYTSCCNRRRTRKPYVRWRGGFSACRREPDAADQSSKNVAQSDDDK